MKEQKSMAQVHEEACKLREQIKGLLAKPTPKRGIEIDLEKGFLIQGEARVEPSLIDLQRKVINSYFNTETLKTVFCRRKDRTMSIGTIGLLKNSDITAMLIWNSEPSEEKPKVWIGFYNLLQWAEAEERAETALGNAQAVIPLSEFPQEILRSVKVRLTKTHGHWASPTEVKHNQNTLPPVMGLKPYSRFPHIYVADIGREERIRAVGEELIQEYAPRLHQTFCQVKEKFLQAIKK